MTAELSPLALGLLAFIASLGVTPLEYPGFWLASLGPGAALAPLAATVAGLAGTLVAAAVVRRRRAAGLIALPAPLALALGLVSMVGAGENLSIFTRAAGAVQATHFPLYYGVVFVAMGAVLAAYFGAEGVARAVSAAFPLVALGLIVIYLSPLGNVDLRNLVGPKPHLATAVDVVTVCSLGAVRGFLLLLAWGHRVRHARAARAAVLWAVGAGGILLALSTALAQAVFGVAEGVTLRFPFAAVMGTVHWQWLPTASFEALTMVIWQIVAFGVVAIYVAMGADLLGAGAPALPRRAAFALAAAPVVVAGFDMSSSLVDLLAAAFNAAVLVVGVAAPALIVLAPAPGGVRARAGRAT